MTKPTAITKLLERSVLFVDLDGTLLDTEALHRVSYIDVIQDVCNKTVELDYEDYVGMREPDIWERLRNHHGISAPTASLTARRQITFKALLEAKPPAVSHRVTALIRRFVGQRILLTAQAPDMATLLLNSLQGGSLFSSIVSTQVSQYAFGKLAAIGAISASMGTSLGDVAWIEDQSTELSCAKELGIFVVVVKRPYNASSQAVADEVILP